MIPNNLLDMAWRIFEADAVSAGVEPSQLDFMMGASTALGVLTGRVNVGIPENTDPNQLLRHLLLELHDMRPQIEEWEMRARDRTARMNKLMG